MGFNSGFKGLNNQVSTTLYFILHFVCYLIFVQTTRTVYI